MIRLLFRRDRKRTSLEQQFPIGGALKPWTVLGAILTLMVTLGFLAVGAGRALSQAHALGSYIPGPATVTAASMRTWVSSGRYGSHTHYEPVIAYAYEVDGQTYRSSAVDATDHTYSPDEARVALMTYRSGKRVTAYHDPAHPSRAFLIHQCRADPYLLIDLSLPFAVIGAYILYKGLPAPDAFARSRRVAMVAVYACALPLLAEVHFRATGGRTSSGILVPDILSALFCLYPFWVWWRLRA